MAFTVLNECFIFSCDLKSILGGGCGKNGSTVAGTSILSPIIPILLVFSFTLIIYTKSTTNVFVDHVALYIITFGFVAAKITNKLVVAHMSKSEMSKIDTIFIGPLMLFFNQYFNFYFDEYLMLWLAFTYILIDFIYFSYSTCRQLADFLNIYILKINEPSDGSSSGGAGGGGGIGGGGPS
ncbi:PREDICTED: choline/ethanolaminephosphotransferase 1-like, partial [Rhagoletis zephyria]|uniref:choline/ethanolaminephosphotransferase 1-like n=1 Tax=Rhagoletis zephyria TaxID=28612 RepID=UPI0008117675